jgi:hypothetical protein
VPSKPDFSGSLQSFIINVLTMIPIMILFIHGKN